MVAVTVQADQVWKVGDALLTEGSQITSNNSQDGFPPSNLLRPESEGYGTNQIIWHSAWTPAAPAGTETYLQTSFGKPVQHIIFTKYKYLLNERFSGKQPFQFLRRNIFTVA